MLNEERQTDKEWPGQINGGMEGGWGISKISFGGGKRRRGGKILMEPKARETQLRMNRGGEEEREKRDEGRGEQEDDQRR